MWRTSFGGSWAVRWILELMRSSGKDYCFIWMNLGLFFRLFSVFSILQHTNKSASRFKLTSSWEQVSSHNNLTRAYNLFSALALLSDDEVRIRQAAGDLLGSFCTKFGSGVFESAKVQVFQLILTNLERSDLADHKEIQVKFSFTLIAFKVTIVMFNPWLFQDNFTRRSVSIGVRWNSGFWLPSLQLSTPISPLLLYQQEESMEGVVDENHCRARRFSEASEIFHETAGWRNLETSVRCLQSMVAGQFMSKYRSFSLINSG